MFNKRNHTSNTKTHLVILRINSVIPAILLLITPIIFIIIADPVSIKKSWNEGRAGFLFAMVFIAAELIGSSPKINRKKLYVLISIFIPTLAYFIAIEDKIPLALEDSIRAAGHTYNVQIDSWVSMWDYIVMSVYVGLFLAILYGNKWYKIAPAGLVFLVGISIILSLDAFFPKDELGPLQYIVPIYLQIDEQVIRFIDTFIMDLGPNGSSKLVTAQNNMLALNGSHGPMHFSVYWPSAGVHSMIIYNLVMLIFLLKFQIPLRRKMIYFLIGSVGTAAVNIIRIISLSLFVLIVSADYSNWQSFHSIAGEIIFMPWLFIYVYGVIFLEKKLAVRRQIVHP